MTTLNTDVVMELMWDEWELLLFGIMVSIMTLSGGLVEHFQGPE